jgi:uncharacterized alpha-E superfamily protein/transglutaminase-like putative cysteine protease
MLLSRVAEAVYWAGRYLERVEDMSRIVQVHGETHVDLPIGADVGWGPLLETCGADKATVERLRKLDNERVSGSPGGSSASEMAVVTFVTTDRDNPSSILCALAAARDNVRVARPVMPREVWELINDLWLASSADADQIRTREGRVRWLRRAVDECVRMNGVLSSTMRRDEAMAFMSIGQQIERADITGRILTVRADSAAPTADRDRYDDVHWMALLRSASAYQPFRRAMPARPDSGATLRFLLQDDSFPRAVSSCLSELRATLKRLPGNEQVLAACTDASVLVADAPVDRMTADELRNLVDDLHADLATIHQRLETAYFRPAPVVVADPEPAGRPSRRFQVPAEGREDPGAGVAGERRIYRVVHRTTYHYGGPVEQAYNEAHLRPRTTPHQRCLSHVLDIEPEPTSRSEYADAFGNAVAIFEVAGGFDRLSVTATSEVALSAPPPPAPSPPWESALWLLDIDRQASSRQARPYRAASRLIPSSSELADYAGLSFPEGRPLVEAVVDLSSRIHRDFDYQPGFTSVTTPVLDVLHYRRGVCQDFAHLAVGCVRSMGLAARYVSGYIETTAPAGQDRLVGADASHAWFSVYLPGWGWIDLDPTNDQLVTDSYVTTAWGRDYGDVSPLRGSVDGGGSSHTLEVAVDVLRLDTTALTR